jgi:hypothetical protein
MKEILWWQNSQNFSPTFSMPCYYVSAGICQRALVDESGITTTQIGMHNRSENGRSAWDVLYNITRQQ